MTQKVAQTALWSVLLGAAGSGWAQQAPAPVVGPGTPTVNRVHLTLDEATARIHRGDWTGAVEAYRAVLNVGEPEPRAQARFGLAVALSQLGREEDALDALKGTLRDGTPLGLNVGLLRARLLLQLADKAMYTKGRAAAAELVRQYDRLPDRPDQVRRQRLQWVLDNVAVGSNQSETKPLLVGVLVPQSGALAPVGQDVVRGLWLGLQELDADQVRVQVFDTANGTGPATERAIGAGMELLIGPVLADDVRQAAPMAAGANVPLLALTSDRQVLGQGVHTLNYLPHAQGAAMARAAIGKGYTRLGGLVPRNPYGNDVWQGFSEAAEAAGASVRPPAYFAPQAVDLGASIRELVGARATDPSATLPFDAVLLPAGPGTLPLALAQLNYHRAGNVPLLGTALWQDSKTLAPDLSGLRGSLFATPMGDAGLREAFEMAFGATPHPLAGLGHDAARVLTELSQRPEGMAVRDALLRPEGFFSPAGFLKFEADGSTRRGLATVRVVANPGGGNQFETVQNPLVLAPLPVPTELRPRGAQGWQW